MVDRNYIQAVHEDEVAYQYDQYGENPHEIDSFATYIRTYSHRLDEVATSRNAPAEKMAVVRKIAALCIRCMEQHEKHVTFRERGKR